MAADNTLINYCLNNMSNNPKQTIHGFGFNLSRTCTSLWILLVSAQNFDNILSRQTDAFKYNCRFKFDFIGLS